MPDQRISKARGSTRCNHWGQMIAIRGGKPLAIGGVNLMQSGGSNRLQFGTGDQFKDIGYIRASDHEEKIKKLVNQLKALGVDIRHQGHQKNSLDEKCCGFQFRSHPELTPKNDSLTRNCLG